VAIKACEALNAEAKLHEGGWLSDLQESRKPKIGPVLLVQRLTLLK
jgi:hypothetical protein